MRRRRSNTRGFLRKCQRPACQRVLVATQTGAEGRSARPRRRETSSQDQIYVQHHGWLSRILPMEAHDRTRKTVSTSSRPSLLFQAKSVIGAVQTSPVKLPPYTSVQNRSMDGTPVGRPTQIPQSTGDSRESMKWTYGFRLP